MTKKSLAVALLGMGAACATVALIVRPCVRTPPGEADRAIPVRIGWNTTWATEGQIIECLKHTNIPEMYGLKAKFTGFSYGGPLSEAALAGTLDVLSAADQPSVTLLSRGANWVVLSRCITFRDALLIPPKSQVTAVSDLRGKKVAVPYGSGAHRVVVKALTDAGLKLGQDVDLLNLDITEINAIIKAGKPDTQVWRGGIAAAASWDPDIAIHEKSGAARILLKVDLVGLRTMSKDLIKKYPDVAVRFLKAVATATLFYAKNKELADRWFANDARVSYDAAILQDAAFIDRNTRAKSVAELELGLSAKQIEDLEHAASFAFENRLITSRPDMSSSIDLSYLEKAMRELRSNPPSIEGIKVRE